MDVTKIGKLLDTFLDNAPSREAKAFARFVLHRPEIAAPIDQIDHVATRQELYRALCDRISTRTDREKICAWASIMILPIDNLQRTMENLDAASTRLCSGVGTLEAVFLDKSEFTRPNLHGSGSGSLSGGFCRNQAEADKCFQRDRQRCMVTGDRRPQACPIFPISAKNMPNPTRDALDMCRGLFSRKDIATWTKLLVHKDLDTSQNMLSLSGSVHEAWKTAAIAFQPLDLLDRGKRLRVAIRYLPRPWNKYPKDPDAAMTELVRDPSTTDVNRLGIVHAVSQQEIVDGQVFEFVEAVDDTGAAIPVPDWNLLQLQWTLLRVAALAGAAEGYEFRSFFDFDDDDEGEWTG